MDPEDLEVVEAQTPAIEEPISQRDEVHNDVAAAIKQLKGEDQPDPVIEEQPEPKGDERPRGPDGKFLPKEQTAAPVTAAPEVITAPDEATKPITQPSTAAVDAPGPWAADAKSLWASLPPAVQAAVAKREAEMNEGGRQWSEQKRRYEQTLAPLVEETQRIGIPLEAGLNAMLSAHRLLSNPQTAPQAIVQLAQQAGVDLANLASNPPAPQTQPQYDPMVQQLTQTVSYLENQLNGFLQNQTMGVVEKFAQDKPHYAAVENDILNILPMVKQANPHASPQEVLDKAYEQAIWINPDVRAKLIAEQTATAQKAQADAIKAKATQASKAAVSIKGSSNGAPPAPRSQPNGADESVYDTVRRTLHELRQ